MKVKQVLIWRDDLRNEKGHKVRTGKIAAQLAHASLAALLSANQVSHEDEDPNTIRCQFSKCSDVGKWLMGAFTKVALKVKNEEELIKVYVQAKQLGLPCSLITDSGLTEFGGNPTNTAVAIGPALDNVIDEITGHLELL